MGDEFWRFHAEALADAGGLLRDGFESAQPDRL